MAKKSVEKITCLMCIMYCTHFLLLTERISLLQETSDFRLRRSDDKLRSGHWSERGWISETWRLLLTRQTQTEGFALPAWLVDTRHKMSNTTYLSTQRILGDWLSMSPYSIIIMLWSTASSRQSRELDSAAITRHVCRRNSTICCRHNIIEGKNQF